MSTSQIGFRFLSKEERLNAWNGTHQGQDSAPPDAMWHAVLSDFEEVWVFRFGRGFYEVQFRYKHPWETTGWWFAPRHSTEPSHFESLEAATVGAHAHIALMREICVKPDLERWGQKP